LTAAGTAPTDDANLGLGGVVDESSTYRLVVVRDE
jgi:hypothetical protein